MTRQQYYKILSIRMKGNTYWKKTTATQFKKGHANLRVSKSVGYHRNKYKLWRLEILERDNYICQDCGDKGDIVHHPKSRREFPELIIDPNNGITLCRSCHLKVHREEIRV